MSLLSKFSVDGKFDLGGFYPVNLYPVLVSFWGGGGYKHILYSHKNRNYFNLILDILLPS